MRSAAVLIAAMLVNLVLSAAAQAAPGDLDPTFSGDGVQTTAFLDDARANGVAIQANGKIVAVGDAISIAGSSDFALARYNPNGTLDKTFSGDGRQLTDFGSVDDRASGVALQSNGSIVAVGRTSSPIGDQQNLNFALARYKANGSLDPTFSGDGKQTADLSGCCGGNDALADVVIQPNGKIVAAGGSTHLGYGLARYTFHGSLDPTFSGDGLQTIDYGIGYAQGASAVALQGDGKIVVVGSSPSGYVDDFALARYLGG